MRRPRNKELADAGTPTVRNPSGGVSYAQPTRASGAWACSFLPSLTHTTTYYRERRPVRESLPKP